MIDFNGIVNPFKVILCQVVRESRSLYIYIYTFYVVVSLAHGPIEYEYFLKIYLIHRWDPNRYYHSGSEWAWEGCHWKGYSTLPRSPALKPDHPMQFSVISRTPLFSGRVLHLYSGYSQRILWPTDWLISDLNKMREYKQRKDRENVHKRDGK